MGIAGGYRSVPSFEGQAVYIESDARMVTDDDLDRSIGVYAREPVPVVRAT